MINLRQIILIVLKCGQRTGPAGGYKKFNPYNI